MNNKILTQEEAENFVRLWQRKPSPTHVGNELGITRQRAQQIATALSDLGVPLLKSYSPFALENNLDIEKLKQVAIWEDRIGGKVKHASDQ